MTAHATIERTSQQDQGASFAQGAQKTGELTFKPTLDVYELDQGYRVIVDLPGAQPEAIDLTVEDGVLSIQASVPDRAPPSAQWLHAEYGVGNYRRRLRLGEDIDPQGIAASYVNGVLTIDLAKRHRHQPRRIVVQGADHSTGGQPGSGEHRPQSDR